MKNLFICFFVGLSLLSCTGDNDLTKSYEGSPLLSFDSKTLSVDVPVGSVTKDADVKFNTIVELPSASVTITAIPLVAGDTAIPAVLGLDYTIATPTVTVNGGLVGKFVIKFIENRATAAGKKALFKISSPTITGAIYNQTIAVTSRLSCPEVSKVNLNIMFDSYASEISWNVKNSSNVIVASSTPYVDGLASFNRQLCLLPGAYRFTMDDVYGDGLFTSAAISGTFSLKLVSGITLVSGGGNFGFTTGPLPFTMN